ncbi:MAG: metallophosphoesterase [Bacteroidales bacterium]|nr:metallophosphoesterase [Bacteroidales bacterium]
MKNICRHGWILLLAVLCLSACAAPGSRLVILHTNDTHSHFDPLRDGTGGVVERAAFVDSVRARHGACNVLLLHAGDFSQGSSYFSILNGDLEIDVINAMGYDCVTLGNHEFDNGLEELARRLSSLQCPVVCANYDFTPFEAGKYITPYSIVRKAGINIGIIGLLCDVSSVVSRETADRMPLLGTNAEVANKWAKYLKEEAQCDKVILLTHIGYSEDVALAAEVHHVDLIVGGHSHTFLEEPTLCTDADGHPLPVITDGCWGLEMGEFSF